MKNLLYFLLTYQNYFFLSMFGTLIFVALVNFAHNPYAKQNVALKKFDKKILEKPSNIVLEIKLLPKEYQRQWRAYVNSKCQKPSVVFEFVKRPQKYLLWFAHFVAVAVCIVYALLSFRLKDPALFVMQIAFLLFSALVLLVKKLIGEINLAHARRIFGKFLHDLNTVTHILKSDKASTMPTTDLPAQNEIDNATTQTLPSCPPAQNQTPIVAKDEDVIEKTVRILKQKGLDNPRTAEEQRKLNIALNNLLQACCKKKS